ncbi:hypothetical protein AA21952_0709 [Acetobacter oeni LMG 21952]|nr:hypothetical protein AA21952_0709 [Acetobacter oeni LMG 21952]
MLCDIIHSRLPQIMPDVVPIPPDRQGEYAQTSPFRTTGIPHTLPHDPPGEQIKPIKQDSPRNNIDKIMPADQNSRK